MKNITQLIIYTSCILLIFLISPQIFGEPAPTEVANTITNYWSTQQFDQLSTYVTNLYEEHTDYVPAILGSSFHDYIFLGKLSEATNKLDRIQQDIDSNPSSYNNDFKELLSGLLQSFDREIKRHADRGTTPEQLESNASPQAVFDASGSLTTIRPLFILNYAPSNHVSP